MLKNVLVKRMSKTSRPIGMSVVTTVAHGKFATYPVVVDYRDVSVREGDIEQTARALVEIHAIERQPLVSADEKERLIWLPTRVREELLEKRWDMRQALLAFWQLRVTLTEEEAKKIPMSEENWKKVEAIFHLSDNK